MIHRRLTPLCLFLLLAPGAGARETVSMTLAECRTLALENNPDIALARKDRLGAELLHDAAHGIFDQLVNASVSTSEEDSPSASQLAGADVLQSESAQVQGSVSQLLPWGASASLGLTTSRYESNNFYQTVNPSYSSSLTLGFDQPFLKNFGKDVTYYQIRQAKLGEKQARERLELSLTLQLQRVEDTYWDLVVAMSELDVVNQSLKVAEDLLSQNKIRVDVGTLAPIELVQAEAGVAIRQEAIIVAEANVANTEDRLKQLMGVAAGSDLWEKTIVPTGEPESAEVPASPEEARSMARDKRPELKIARRDLESRSLATTYQKNQSRPSLDLRASYGGGGLGGDTLIYDDELNVIGVQSGGAGDALEQSFGFDYPVWSVGLTYSYPIRNRAGKAAYAGARIDEEKAAIGLRKTELDVDIDVRTAYRALETARKSLEASRASERAEAKKLEAEQKKFENGLSTSFQVLDFDEDLARARSALRRAEINVHKAVVNLERATGAFLEERGLSVEE